MLYAGSSYIWVKTLYALLKVVCYICIILLKYRFENLIIL
jgi:hypothetical protein